MPAAERLGPYLVQRQIGRGAMGTVYEGFDPIANRVIAIKTVRLCHADNDESLEAIARFRREAKAAGQLVHPNIVEIFDYGETDDLAYIVMEFVDGPELKSLLDKKEMFPLSRIAEIMQDIMAGLQHSHELGVVHRDIKPSNLILTKSGKAKIADFGIARIESSSMTQGGAVLGTPAYMSPEQFMGQVVDARTDIYSSGVLLYQLLTGERPYEGSMSAIMHKALNTDAPSPSQISVTAPPPFDAVVRRAMEKRPQDRFPTAGAFALAISQAFSASIADDNFAQMGRYSSPRGAATLGDNSGELPVPPHVQAKSCNDDKMELAMSEDSPFGPVDPDQKISTPKAGVDRVVREASIEDSSNTAASKRANFGDLHESVAGLNEGMRLYAGSHIDLSLKVDSIEEMNGKLVNRIGELVSRIDELTSEIRAYSELATQNSNLFEIALKEAKTNASIASGHIQLLLDGVFAVLIFLAISAVLTNELGYLVEGLGIDPFSRGAMFYLSMDIAKVVISLILSIGLRKFLWPRLRRLFLDHPTFSAPNDPHRP